MDRFGTPDIIDICLTAAVLLVAVVGSWRGAVKEVFVSAALLLGVVLAGQWNAEWAVHLSDILGLSQNRSALVIEIGVPLLAVVLIGYLASVNAGIPPADAPGRVGGFVLGGTNAIVYLASAGQSTYTRFLSPGEQDDVAASHVGRALIFDFDRILLAATAVTLVMAFASVSIRRRRAAILGPSGLQGSRASGYQVRRERPLAPEAEKIESTSWTARSGPLGETVPLARVQDSSQRLDRVPASPSWNAITPDDVAAANAEVVRCVSCGERLTAEDRFCPRCGRSLSR